MFTHFLKQLYVNSSPAFQCQTSSAIKLLFDLTVFQITLFSLHQFLAYKEVLKSHQVLSKATRALSCNIGIFCLLVFPIHVPSSRILSPRCVHFLPCCGRSFLRILFTMAFNTKVRSDHKNTNFVLNSFPSLSWFRQLISGRMKVALIELIPGKCVFHDFLSFLCLWLGGFSPTTHVTGSLTH